MNSRDNSTAWFVGIIIALALLAIGYLVFTAQDASTAASLKPPLTETEKTWFMECLKYSYITDCRTRLDYIRTMG